MRASIAHAPASVAAKSVAIDARILIVDDEAPYGDVRSAIPAGQSCDTSAAASAADALVIVAATPPALILADVNMPDMGGDPLAARIKAGATTSHIPIIVVTAARDQRSRLLGLTAGAENFDGPGALTLDVSCNMLPPAPRSADTAPATMVTSMATRLEALIATYVIPVPP